MSETHDSNPYELSDPSGLSSASEIHLSERENQILLMASRGQTDQAIAHSLGISPATVATYWGRIRIKYGPISRTEIVARHLQNHIKTEIVALTEANKKLAEELQDRAKANERLEESFDFLRAVFEAAPDGILVCSETGMIERINSQAEEMFGYREGELIGCFIEDLVPVRYRGAHQMHRRTYMQDPAKRKMGPHLATLGLKRDGSEFPIAAALSTARVANQLIITCIVRDLTPRLEGSVGREVAAEWAKLQRLLEAK